MSINIRISKEAQETLQSVKMINRLASYDAAIFHLVDENKKLRDKVIQNKETGNSFRM